MRRQIGKFLPIFAIAVLVQLFAPIAASWAMSAALDPLASAPICANMGEGGSQQQPSGHLPDQNCCPLCSIAQNLALADDLGTAVATPKRYAILVAWSDGASDAASARYDSDAQARAPPFYS